MSVNKKTAYGKINIANKAIASVVASAALECYGVVGLSEKNSLVVKVADKIQSILTKDEYVKGVSVFQDKNSISISLYIVISYGVKVTEVLNEVQKKVKYVAQKTFDITINKVNVYAVSLRKID